MEKWSNAAMSCIKKLAVIEKCIKKKQASFITVQNVVVSFEPMQMQKSGICTMWKNYNLFSLDLIQYAKAMWEDKLVV